MTLVLFDIDGTLLTTGDLSRRTFAEVATQVIGRDASLEGVLLSGRTDPQIMRGLLLANGLCMDEADEVLASALDIYQLRYLEALGRVGAKALDGAKDVVERLTATQATPNSGVLMGLLTGNLKSLVTPKLAAAGIPSDGFLVGAFGSDRADRNQLPGIAMERARESCDASIRADEVVIVGDTPLDVHCARLFGAVSVAVASGDYTYRQLQDTGPDYVLAGLYEWDLVEREIGCRP